MLFELALQSGRGVRRVLGAEPQGDPKLHHDQYNNSNDSIGDYDITINLLNGNICLYDGGYNYVMAKNFYEFLGKIIYERIL